MSNDQPGPYGQQPPPGPPPGGPGPYGPPQGQQPGGPSPYAPQGGAPGGSGFGPPAQGGASPAPAGAWGPQPHGQPPAQPPAGPPAPPQGGGGGGGGRRTGIVVAAVVALAAVVGGAIFLLGGDGDDEESGANGDAGTPGGGSAGSYTLVLPETSGDFTLAEPAQNVSDLDPEELAALGLADANGTSGTYLGGVTPEEAAQLSGPQDLGDRQLTSMNVIGLWGEVGDPESAMDAAFAYGAEQALSQQSGLALQGEPQRVTPDGLPDGVVMQCQLAAGQNQGVDITVPICAWADSSTMALTVSLRQTAEGPTPVDMEEAAAATAQLRADSLQEAGQ
ncbi:hypothetical protein [Streptomyces hoynatensis]|uniref:Uncharacterized protein n=1 Tax=Streptomyces hoynatensis TaxID=1141874 RepID=A0A3A9YNU4_9ACTN|nr:hypothetical protein [Streptomyces hoynatensis]RKN37649.1 hypothetical protein D7294_27345 [Streptomyces hoynatensis]